MHQKRLIKTLVICMAVVGLIGALTSTAFAQTTYVITDGDQTTVFSTYRSNPDDILLEAGLTLEEGDYYTTQETENGIPEIRIARVQYITIMNCGEEMLAESYGETVAQLLNRLGIPAYGEYSVSVPVSSETFDGMEIVVEQNSSETQTYNVEIPFKTTYGYDDTLAKGEEIIITEGVPGKATRTDSVIFKNYEEVSRTCLEEVVLKQPVNQYVLRGTGENVGAVRTQPIIGDGFIVTPEGDVLTYSHSDQYLASAYNMADEGCDEITATGTIVRTGTVAVDPTLIPYFTEMYIVSNDGKYVYGLSRAEDCGGAIQGKRLDLYFHTLKECFQFGLRDCTVYFLTDNG